MSGKEEKSEAKQAVHTRTRIAKERMLEAMEKTLGIITNACKLAKVSRTQYYEWYNNDLNFKKAVDDISEISIDFSESALFTLIKGAVIPEDKIFVNAKGKKTVVKTMKHFPPDTGAVLFHLQTKGKARGYIKTTEFELPEAITKITITRKTINSKEDLSKNNNQQSES